MLMTKLKMAAAATLLVTLLAGSDVKLEQKVEDKNEIFDDGVSSSVILRRGPEPEFYNEIFVNLLDAVGDYFEISHANRYEGRIETMSQSLLAHPIHLRRRAVIMIRCENSGGYVIDVAVAFEKDKKTSKSDKKDSTLPPDETQRQSLGRDTVLEKVILRRVIEQDRHRR